MHLVPPEKADFQNALEPLVFLLLRNIAEGIVQAPYNFVKYQSITKTYFQLGGKHVQFNAVDSNTLIEATRKPEKYRDLIVRAAGYSAYFVKLTPAIQTEIIPRSVLRSA